jgi:adenine-specific DNA-methyltransferase
MDYKQLSRTALIHMLEQQEAALMEAGRDGIVMNYTGRTAPWQIIRQVKPKLSRIIKKASEGNEKLQSENEIWDGENLSTMVTLYKYRGQVDLIMTDPPYNTGEDFRYNDKWDTDPNDPDLGALVPKDDGSRHSKWLRFMTPRVWMMREMLKPNGVIAICIDHRELYRLGMVMDEIFKEENRIGIINWQKSYSPKSGSTHVSTATEYVLIYAKNANRAKTGLEVRTDAMDDRFWNPDNDPDGEWKINSDASAKDSNPTGTYAIQSPFTGNIFYPRNKEGHWAFTKTEMLKWLREWGAEYEERDIGDNLQFNSKKGVVIAKALVIKGTKFKDGIMIGGDKVIKLSSKRANAIIRRGQWPKLHFGPKGTTSPQIKRHLKYVRNGKVPMTFWANEDFETPLDINSVSWAHAESGHSQTGVNELDAVVGKGHGFETVKPLRLMKKIIQLWSLPDGLILDPFAGSGTTGHAVIELNNETDNASRRFILIEQGNTEKGDRYAKSLTADRVKRAITGSWASGKKKPMRGGFRFIELRKEKIDAEAVNALAREEMIDLLLTSYWDKSEKAKSYLRRLPAGSHGYLFAVNTKNEGFFLIWDSADKPSVLNRDIFRKIVEEAKNAGLESRYHIYASMAPYTGPSIEFYKIPDKVLEHIGFNQRSDAFNNEQTDHA